MKKEASSKKENESEKWHDLINKSLVYIGALATVFSCVITFLAFIKPTVITTFLVTLYPQDTPIPQIIKVTLSPQPTLTQFPPQFIEVTRIVEETHVVEQTRIVEVTRIVVMETNTPIPDQGTIVLNYEGRTTQDDFIFNLTKIQREKSKMRWYISFWNKTKSNIRFRLDLTGCAYVANRDDGTRYPILDSNFRSGQEVIIQSQTRLDLWFDFDDAISLGATNFTVGLCAYPHGGPVFFETFDIDITS